MLLNILCIVTVVCASRLHAAGVFPEALVFQGLGLPDIMINNSDAAAEKLNGTFVIAGDLNDALTTMNFHREKLNDYLCRKYVVGEILQDISDGALSESRSMSSDDQGMSKSLAMQTDQGSAAYNAWLIKTQLLKRIYDEYDLNVKMYEKPVGFTLKHGSNESLHDHDTMKKLDDTKQKKQHSHEDSISSPSETVSVDISQSHSYDFGDDHGYNNSPNPASSYGPPTLHSPTHEPHPSSYGPPKNPTLSYGPPPHDYPYMPLTYYGPPNQQPHVYDLHAIRDIEKLNQSNDEKNISNGESVLTRGLTAADLYDLTLTAIAFLGFGTFVMNLVMDAMSIQTGATLFMNTLPFLGAGATVSRTRRHANPAAWEVNELSWTVVSTMDSMMANVEETSVDCEEVKQACQISNRLVKTGTNFSSKLLPVWNVALGWLSKKLGKNTGQPVISALLGHCILPSQCQ